MRVGVNNRAIAARNGDMSFPEDKIAAPERRRAVVGNLHAERRLLLIAVARSGHAGSIQRDLDEARTIEAKRGLAAPEIGRTDEFAGDGNARWRAMA